MSKITDNILKWFEGLERRDSAFDKQGNWPEMEGLVIPNDFKNERNPYNQYIDHWFFEGINLVGLDSLKSKAGNPIKDELARIIMVLMSYNLEHNYKISLCAYMLDDLCTLTSKEI
jgi:hypothetical protein